MKYQIWINGKCVSHPASKFALLLYKRATQEYKDADVRLYQERNNGLGLKQILPKLGIAVRAK
jgi:hypothetical protein